MASRVGPSSDSERAALSTLDSDHCASVDGLCENETLDINDN